MRIKSFTESLNDEKMHLGQEAEESSPASLFPGAPCYGYPYRTREEIQQKLDVTKDLYNRLRGEYNVRDQDVLRRQLPANINTNTQLELVSLHTEINTLEWVLGHTDF